MAVELIRPDTIFGNVSPKYSKHFFQKTEILFRIFGTKFLFKINPIKI